MENESSYYTVLISRYFYGEATPSEILELEAWVKAGPGNAGIFKEYQKTWKSIENSRIASSVNTDLEWLNLASKLHFQPHVMHAPEPGVQTVEPRIRTFRRPVVAWSLRIAAICLILLIPAYFIYHNGSTPEVHTLAVSEITEHILPDGSAVTLNAGAILTYPSRFEGSFRKVTLEGEGWFEVAHDKAKPFIIAAGKARVRVVGTTFFINTRTYRNTKEIILASGVVNVYYEDHPETATLLFPGEKAELEANSGDIVKSGNIDENFLAWKTKRLVFNNSPLNEVAALLSKVYHKDIRLSGNSLSDCRITATFDRQSLETVLNVLQATLNLQLRDTGAGIEISGNGCEQSR